MVLGQMLPLGNSMGLLERDDGRECSWSETTDGAGGGEAGLPASAVLADQGPKAVDARAAFGMAAFAAVPRHTRFSRCSPRSPPSIS